MNTERIFHLGDILSVTTGYLVSPRHIGGVYDILNFMTGENLFTHQLPRAARESRPFLAIRYPHLTEEALGAELAELKAGLEKIGDEREHRDEASAYVDSWVAKLAARFGESLPVNPNPPGENGPRDPIAELIAMRGSDEGIVVVER